MYMNTRTLKIGNEIIKVCTTLSWWFMSELVWNVMSGAINLLFKELQRSECSLVCLHHSKIERPLVAVGRVPVELV